MDAVFSFIIPCADHGGGDGLLDGVRVAPQPNVAVAGWPSEAGSKALAGFKALEDAVLVKRLRAAGARLCGLTRMSEFGFGLDGGCTAGQAVEAGSADAEIVLDMTGESRLCAGNVCAFKPSYGIVPRVGVTGLIPSMETPGVLARDPGLIRRLMQALAGPDETDFSVPDETPPPFAAQSVDPAKTKVGLIKEAREGLSDAQAEGFDASVAELEQAGFCVEEISFPDYRMFVLAHRIIGAVEASSCAGRYDSVRYGRREPGAKDWNEMYLSARGAAFGPLIKSLLFEGAYFQFERYSAYEAACRLRSRLVTEMDRLTGQVDFLAMPLPGKAADAGTLPLDETYAKSISTLFANVTGQPVVCLPSANGTPQAGMQLAAKRRCDGRLIDLGEFILERRGKGGCNGI
ncbi:MAG: amidase family protein [Kiritimatiellae bacterium]|nr:amidase family protein [Kiritimatiellia bacterium]